MKKAFCFIFVFFIGILLYGQSSKYDSLKNLVTTSKDGSVRLLHLRNLIWQQMWSFPDSALAYLPAEVQLANELRSKYALSVAFSQYGVISYIKGNFSEAIRLILEGLKIAEQSKEIIGIGTACGFLNEVYAAAGDFEKAIYYYSKFRSYYEPYFKSLQKNDADSTQVFSALVVNMFNTANLAKTYEKFDKLDSALKYVKIADDENYRLFSKNSAFFPEVYGNVFFKKKDYHKALEYYKVALRNALNNDIKKEIMEAYNGMAQSFYQLGRLDSATYFALKSIEQSQFVQFPLAKLTALNLMASTYKALGQVDSANKYIELSIATKDSMFNQQKVMQLETVTFSEQLRLKSIEEAKQSLKIRITTYLLISGLLVLLIIILILNHHSRERQKAKVKIEQAYDNLKATQAQLIQSEKEQMRTYHEKELLNLEANALRAQMNPHFIFNCMNSIKALIQQHEEESAIVYLTAFSKLIRTIFQNSDKREISLFDEIETCRLYTQLESMRFGNKFNYEFCVDETIDMKSVTLPPMIIQPFIENAIWHGIMPKENGGVLQVTLKKENQNVLCIIDDNGVGRKMSKQNEFKLNMTGHQSRGVRLTQTRLDLDNLLNDRNGSVNIIDKKNNEGNPQGTTVVLKFNAFDFS
jgi:sensor histidine kinase YesM